MPFTAACFFCLHKLLHCVLGSRTAVAAAAHWAECAPEQECLQRWINARASVRQDAKAECRRCEVCQAPYTVRVDTKLGKGKLCSMASWSQYCACVLLLFMCAVLAWVTLVYINSGEYKNEKSAGTNWMLGSITATSGVVVLCAAKKTYEQWRDINVSETVHVNERADPGAAVTALPVEQSSQGALLTASAETSSAEVLASVLLHAAPVEVEVEQLVAKAGVPGLVASV